MSTPAIIYLRVSTDDQAASGLGLEAQYEACEKHAASRDWETIAVFTDAGVSGSIPLRERPAGAEAVALARKVGGILLVAKMDRASRDTIDRLVILGEAADEGWRIESPDMMDVDVSTPEGKLMHTIMAGVAEYERAIARARTRAALRAKIKRGERVGRRPEIDPAAIARVRELYVFGWTYAELDTLLRDEGFMPPRSATWSRTTLRRMITGEPSGAVSLELWREKREEKA